MKAFILILLALLVLLYKQSPGSSKFTNSEDPGSTMIFHAPWCGHCKASMSEFTKASEDPRANIKLINTDKPENKPLVKQHGVNGFPTIMKEDGTKYTGKRTADEIVKFALS